MTATTDPAGTADNPLARRFTIPSLLRFAFPTIFMMVFFGLYTIVDTLFIARFVNADALSSVNIVTPAINIVVGLGTMLASGGVAIVARKLGAGREEEARSNLTLIVLAGLAVGIALAAGGLLLGGRLVLWLGASERLFPYADAYLSILLLFAPANIVQIIFAVFFVAAGRPGLGMAAGVSGGLVNAALDYAFMGPLGMGIAGAALATGIGYTVPAAVGVAFFFRNRDGALRFARPEFDAKVLSESCANGSSEMVSQGAAAVTTFFFNAAMMRLLGESGVAALTIIIYSQFMLTTLHIGFSMGVAPVISYAFGAGDAARLRRLLRMCAGVVAACSLAVFGAALFGGESLMRAFSPEGGEVFAVSGRGFEIFRYSFLLCGFNIFLSAFFTALSNGLVSAVISFSRTFVFLLAGIFLLPRWFGVDGVWMTIPLSELLAFALSLVLVAAQRRRYGYL